MIRYSIGSINFSALTLRFFASATARMCGISKENRFFRQHFTRNIFSVTSTEMFIHRENCFRFITFWVYIEKNMPRAISRNHHTRSARGKNSFSSFRSVSFTFFFSRSARSRYLVRIVHSPFGHPLTLRLVLLVLFWDASIRIRPRYDKKLNRMRDRENQLSTTNSCPCKSKCHTLTYASVMPETTNKT